MNLTTPAGTKLPITTNPETNGYCVQVPGKAYHVQFWYDTSVRVWYCAGYQNGTCYQAACTDDSYDKPGILTLAGRIADAIAADTLDPTYL